MGPGYDKCDFCGAEYYVPDRHVVAAKRPSDPTSMCSIMWGCGKCDESVHLPTSAQVGADIEAGKYPGVLFWEG